MIGSLGNIAFSASSDRLFTFKELTMGGDARYAKHELIGKKPLLEFIGPGTTTANLPIRLDITHGVNPLTEIKRLADLRDNGQAMPLVIGDNFKGYFVITSMNESHRAYNNAGLLLLAEITLQLEEYSDDRVRNNS